MHEDANSYTECCVVCQDVNWGITDERSFYCKSCNNVTDKVLECDDPSAYFDASAKVITISKGIRGKDKYGRSYRWYTCEGFQMVLCMQADALQALGVNARLKDDLLMHMWRRYLQYTARAYVEPRESDAPAKSPMTSPLDSGSELNVNPMDLETTSLKSFSAWSSQSDATSGDVGSGISSGDECEPKMGSVDGKLLSHSGRVEDLHLSLSLAFCHLALMWLRQPPTLLDLLRLVRCGTVPYTSAFESFPEEMKIYGHDARFFRPTWLPRYHLVLRESQLLAEFLKLPCFPEVTERSIVHPHALVASFLHRLCLPDSLLPWCCWVMALPKLLIPSRLTFDPTARRWETLRLELVAVASILVALKLLLVLDDCTEWKISRAVRKLVAKPGEPWFCFDDWCRAATALASRERDAEARVGSRRSWVQSRTFYYTSRSYHCMCAKRQKLALDLEQQVRRSLAGVEQQKAPGPGADSASRFYGHAVVGVMDKRLAKRVGSSGRYWSTPRQPGKHGLPHSFRFVLEVTASLLGAEQSDLLSAVCSIEKKLLPAVRALPKQR
ncbi:TATA box-binding protein-associated factor RNA polymerase I subunit B isoform X1 [Petromyzon marinus]|uniref:TATA box-binding protein-associated factor RNA polymerase I subunit B isoform X1 n=1 Tax=Petromyzon marinus TaxID=7757 RepID=A0AAJ7TIG5_PETMA|nr:TATA box-binding protein-associated factor RNA polymerase I subunit B isoform X1 [Petromyzon marinus]